MNNGILVELCQNAKYTNKCIMYNIRERHRKAPTRNLPKAKGDCPDHVHSD
jgi:hypothetical protein